MIHIPYTKPEDYTPEQAQAEYVELLVKAGRRCAYDLSHAASMIDYRDVNIKKSFEARAKYWQSVFNPGKDAKNYRNNLHNYIDQLSSTQYKLIKLLEDHGIDHSEITQDDIPF